MTILRRIDPSRRMARFYALSIEPTLFGDWAVVRRWGRINTQGRSLETWFEDHETARAACTRQRQAKERRGYLVIEC